MTKSKIEEMFPTLAPLPGKIGRGSVSGTVAASKAIWRTGKRVCKPTLAILLLLIAVHAVATLIAGRKLAAKIAEIKSNGGYVSCAELAGPPVPASENGALLYEKAFKLVPERPPLFEESACELLMDPYERAKDPTLWLKAKSDVAEYARGLALVAQAQKMPRSQFKINWADGFTADFPHHYQLRQLASILAADALINARNANTTAAIHSLEMLFGLQHSIKSEPSTGSIWIRSLMIATGQDALTQVLGMVRVPESDAKRLASQLQAESVTSDFSNAMQGERAVVIHGFDIIRDEGNPILVLRAGDPPLIDMMDVYFSGVGRPWLYSDELRVLECWDEVVRLHHRPYRDIDQASIARINKLSEATGILSFFCSDYLRDHATAESADAKLTGSRLVLALNVYKQRHKAYPDTLAKLRSSINWAPRDVDPFSGKDFVYHRVGNGFTLYSIGPNLKDNGGVITPRAKPGSPMGSPPPMPDPDRDDIVWKITNQH